MAAFLRVWDYFVSTSREAEPGRGVYSLLLEAALACHACVVRAGLLSLFAAELPNQVTCCTPWRPAVVGHPPLPGLSLWRPAAACRVLSPPLVAGVLVSMPLFHKLPSGGGSWLGPGRDALTVAWCGGSGRDSAGLRQRGSPWAPGLGDPTDACGAAREGPLASVCSLSLWGPWFSPQHSSSLPALWVPQL